jgi:predicted dehydrogenase
MTEQKYKAAIIGLGFIGGADQVSGDALGQRVEDLDGTHFVSLSQHPQIELVAGSSRDAGRRERFAARSNAKTYSDWREMLDSENLDIVGIATYAPQHAEMTIACTERGVRAIYCEKPIATNAADADRMLAACQSAGSLLVINHNRRFNPNLRRLKTAIADGLLGELTSASLQWPSGRLGNVGTHMIDAARMLIGRRIDAVSGTLDLTGRPDCRGSEFRDPGGWGVIRFEGGLMVTVDATDEACVPPLLTFNGTAGRAFIRNFDVELEFWDDRREQWPEPQDGKMGMDRAVGEIVEWLDGSEFPYSTSEAVETLEAIVAFHVSHDRSAAWATLPLTGTDRQRDVQSG